MKINNNVKTIREYVELVLVIVIMVMAIFFTCLFTKNLLFITFASLFLSLCVVLEILRFKGKIFKNKIETAVFLLLQYASMCIIGLFFVGVLNVYYDKYTIELMKIIAALFVPVVTILIYVNVVTFNLTYKRKPAIIINRIASIIAAGLIIGLYVIFITTMKSDDLIIPNMIVKLDFLFLFIGLLIITHIMMVTVPKEVEKNKLGE